MLGKLPDAFRRVVGCAVHETLNAGKPEHDAEQVQESIGFIGPRGTDTTMHGSNLLSGNRTHFARSPRSGNVTG